MKKILYYVSVFVLTISLICGCVGCGSNSENIGTQTPPEGDVGGGTQTPPATEDKESLTLSQTTLKIKEKEQVSLSVSVTPLGTSVLWESSDENVAIVSSSGKVTGFSAGTTTITVKTVSGKASATCAVTVVKEETPAPTVSVVLSKSELEMDVGESYQLSALVSPSDSKLSVAWSSTNETVVTVNNGLVKAVSAGLAFIQAKAGDATAVCTVEVKEVYGSISGTITCRNRVTDRDEVDPQTMVYLISDEAPEVNLNNLLMGFDYPNSREEGIYATAVDSLGNYSIENIKLGNYRMIITCRGSNFSLDAGSVTPSKIKEVLGSVYQRGDSNSKEWIEKRVGYNNQILGFNVTVGKTPLKITKRVYGVNTSSNVK